MRVPDSITSHTPGHHPVSQQLQISRVKSQLFWRLLPTTYSHNVPIIFLNLFFTVLSAFAQD